MSRWRVITRASSVRHSLTPERGLQGTAASRFVAQSCAFPRIIEGFVAAW